MEPESQLRRPRPETYEIADIVELASRGRLRIPRFQRPFVWDSQDVRTLFDSIWRGFPVGTLLFWARPAPADVLSFGSVQVKAGATETALWVVDGQQRVTSLVGALGQASGEDPLFELCFDLHSAKFVHASRRPLPAWWLPLRVSLESRTLLAWERTQGDQLTPDDLDLADALAGALRDYKIPAYIVEGEDEEILRSLFDRVNSAGHPISRAQVFHALFGGRSETATVEAVAESLARREFGAFDPQRVVQSLLAIRGGDVARDLHNEFGPNEDRDYWFEATEHALGRVITFMRSQGVPHLDVVPSTLPVPALAAFFHLHPDTDTWNLRLLSRWLWRGWVHGYGRAGQTPALRQTVRAVHPKKGDPSQAPSEYQAIAALLGGVPDEPVPDVAKSPFRTDTVNGRLQLLALLSLGPRGSSGEPIDVIKSFQQHGVEAVRELVRGHRSLIASRGFWPVGETAPTGKEPVDVLESQAIDSEASDALQAGDINAFIRTRGSTISMLVKRFLEIHVEHGKPPRPPLEDLLVPDEELVIP